MSYKVEIIEKKDLIVQLEAIKSSIKDFFDNLLNEGKYFKYQITVKVLLKKYKPNWEIEFATVYFNSTTKTVIRHKFSIENAFQEIFYMIDVWINEGSGWITESVESQYINISTYRPLSGSPYISLPVELNSPRKGPINIKNVFYGHVRHINPSKEHPEGIRKINNKFVKHITNPEEITEGDKEFISDLDYDGIEFSCEKKILARLR